MALELDVLKAIGIIRKKEYRLCNFKALLMALHVLIIFGKLEANAPVLRRHCHPPALSREQDGCSSDVSDRGWCGAAGWEQL